MLHVFLLLTVLRYTVIVTVVTGTFPTKRRFVGEPVKKYKLYMVPTVLDLYGTVYRATFTC